MRATDFEVRHRILLHRLVILAAFLTYLIDRDDIVWRFIKDASDVRTMERIIFAIATLLFGVAAWMCTRNRVAGRSAYAAEFVYAIALGSLAPLAGFVILVMGEAVRLSRLALREAASVPETWAQALRAEAVKWGLFLTMIAFTITLRDRVGEVLVGVSVLFSILLNALSPRQSKA